jgi:ABC-2 type transport system permease protein
MTSTLRWFLSLRVARRELIDALRDGRVRIATAALVVLMLVTLAVGVQQWQTRRDSVAAAQTTDATIWRNQGALNPHSAAHFGRYVFKEPGPLAFLDDGIQPYVGSAIWLEAHRQTPARSRPAEDAALPVVFGELDAALLLQLLVPLLIVLGAFASFSGERENGTFRLLLSMGVPRSSLLAGKALGLSAAPVVLLVPLVAIAAVALLLDEHRGNHLSSDLARLVLFAIAYAVYFATWVAVTLGVSVRAKSSRQALTVLIGLWLLACVLLPRLAIDAADMKNGIGGHDPADKRLDGIKQALFKQYGVSRLEDLPVNFDGIELAEGERYGNQVMDRQFGRLWAQYERQASVQSAFAWASPMLALRSVSMALAGTDLVTHRKFTEQAEQFRRTFILQLNDYHTKHGKFNDLSFTADPQLWSQVPPFRYLEPSLGESLRPQLGNVSLLLLWLAAAAAGALFAIHTAPVEADR